MPHEFKKQSPVNAGVEANSSPSENRDEPDSLLLGLSTSALAGLSVENLLNNQTAITMLMHYYKRLNDENNSLKNDVNTYKSYVDGYERKKNNTTIATILLVLSNIFIGFGVNLITSQQVGTGMCVFIPGVALTISGLYFSLKDKG